MIPLVIILASLLIVDANPSDPAPGVSVLRRMNAAHRGGWYRTLAQYKRATFVTGERTRQDSWVDLVRPPGRRRMDLAPQDSADATLMLGDSLFDVRRGAVVRALAYSHPLSMLLHDVHVADVGETARRLRAAGFDLDRVRDDRWQGRPAIVVGGAGPDDRLSRQFWVDAERLVLVRLIEPRDPERTIVQETWLEDYRPIGTAWVARRLLYLRNGVVFLRECVRAVQPNVPLPDSIWRRAPWTRAPWQPPARTDTTSACPSAS